MSYTAKVIAVLGRTLRAGRWKLADDSLVIAVFGRCVLDLSRAYVDEEDDELSMTVFCLFGSVSIVLPPGCDLEPSGIALLASSEVEIPSDRVEDVTEDVLAPLDISWFAMFGRVRINELSPLSDAEAGIGEAEAAKTHDSLGAPAVHVFAGADPDTRPAPSAPDPAVEAARAAEAAADAAAEAAAEAESEQAALRDEIAQWRSETGRTEPDNRPAEDDATLEGAS